MPFERLKDGRSDLVYLSSGELAVLLAALLFHLIISIATAANENIP